MGNLEPPSRSIQTLTEMKAIVNKELSQRAGEILRGINIRKDFYQRIFLNLKAVRETKMKVYLFSAAICHQTYTLFHKTKNIYGWDFMEYGFQQMVNDNALILNPEFLATSPEKEIKDQLRKYFSHDNNPDNCTLDRLDERTIMLKEIGKSILHEFEGRACNLIDQSENNLYNNGKGIYETLAGFSAFSDPQRKKITFFIKLAVDAGILKIHDEENIIPIMDYHMQRVMMRMGCVEITDKELRNRLLSRQVVESDNEIRQACIDSISIIAKTSSQGILKMNDYFWPLGRSCCNETTLCHDESCEKDPCSFNAIAELDSHNTCIFENICKGSSDESYRKLWQPVIDTNYY